MAQRPNPNYFNAARDFRRASGRFGHVSEVVGCHGKTRKTSVRPPGRIAVAGSESASRVGDGDDRNRCYLCSSRTRDINDHYSLLSREEEMADVDQEVKAMGNVAAALEGLDEDAIARVLRWAAQRFGGAKGEALVSATPGSGGSGNGGSGASVIHEPPAFEDFVDLFDAATPKTEADRALVGGYWLQVVSGNADFQSQDVNTALKDLGHGVSNITAAFDSLQERKPALVRQVAKSGRTRQARKKYKLTQAGITAVGKMLSGETDDEQE